MEGGKQYPIRLWIPPPPLRSAPKAEPKSTAPPQQASRVTVSSFEQFVNMHLFYQGNQLNYFLDAYDAVWRAKPMLPGGYEVIAAGQQLLVDAGFYTNLVRSLEDLLKNKLTDRAKNNGPEEPNPSRRTEALEVP